MIDQQFMTQFSLKMKLKKKHSKFTKGPLVTMTMNILDIAM